MIQKSKYNDLLKENIDFSFLDDIDLTFNDIDNNFNIDINVKDMQKDLIELLKDLYQDTI